MRRASNVWRAACARRRRRSPASTAWRCANARPSGTASGFAILESGGGRAATAIGPDSAICADCLREMLDPADRRYRYAFINCTNCGPRYTITQQPAVRSRDDQHGGVRAVPARVSVNTARRSIGAFTPSRMRAPTAARSSPCSMPRAARAGRRSGRGNAGPAARGEIVAVKGLGGFHLACDARNADAVARLRARKARDEKPFAVMVANVASARRWAADRRRRRRRCWSRPNAAIVLLRKRSAMRRRAAPASPPASPGSA